METRENKVRSDRGGVRAKDELRIGLYVLNEVMWPEDCEGVFPVKGREAVVEQNMNAKPKKVGHTRKRTENKGQV